MASRGSKLLQALQVEKEKRPGRYCDGNGLYLRVELSRAPLKPGEQPRIVKSWLLRYRLAGTLSSNGKKLSRELGLGSFADFTLVEARERARKARQLVADGIDPIDAKAAVKLAKKLENDRLVTFREAAKAYIAKREINKPWKNDKHRYQWTATLEQFAYPVIGNLPVSAIDRHHIIEILDPIWAEKTETASRLRGRIETVLDFADGRGWRSGVNPAQWSGPLKDALGGLSVDEVKKANGKGTNYPALPYRQMEEFMKHLRVQEGLAAKALEFAILTASRTSPIIKGKRSEIDVKERVWVIPATHMKSDRDHDVPLVDKAIAIIEEHTPADPKAKLFPLSNGAMLALIRRMNKQRKAAGLPQWVDPKLNNRAVTPHGFRSSFKDWSRDVAHFPDELSEAALAHAIEDKTKGAYARGTMFEKRRHVMEAWLSFIDGEISSNVVVLERAAS